MLTNSLGTRSHRIRDIRMYYLTEVRRHFIKTRTYQVYVMRIGVLVNQARARGAIGATPLGLQNSTYAYIMIAFGVSSRNGVASENQ